MFTGRSVSRRRVLAEAALLMGGAGLGSLPVTERLASRVLSLPMFPEFPLEQVDYVAEAVNELSAAHG